MTIGTYAMILERIAVMTPTRSYMQHSFVFAFVESIETATSLVRLLAPFQESLWISLLVLVVVSIVFIFLSKSLTRRQRHFITGGRLNRTPILNMLSSLIGNAISNPRMMQRIHFGTFARTLAILWIFFWLIVRNAYQGGLYEHFQRERNESLYDKVDKIRNSTVKINVLTVIMAVIPENFDSKRYLQTPYFCV